MISKFHFNVTFLGLENKEKNLVFAYFLGYPTAKTFYITRSLNWLQWGVPKGKFGG